MKKDKEKIIQSINQNRVAKAAKRNKKKAASIKRRKENALKWARQTAI